MVVSWFGNPQKAFAHRPIAPRLVVMLMSISLVLEKLSPSSMQLASRTGWVCPAVLENAQL